MELNIDGYISSLGLTVSQSNTLRTILESIEEKDREIERLKSQVESFGVWITSEMPDDLIKAAIEFGAENSRPFGDDDLNEMLSRFKTENNL